MLKKYRIKVILLVLSVFICQLFLLNVNAYVGNGFLWNKTEIYVDLNSNFDDYIKEFEVKFYYWGTSKIEILYHLKVFLI